MQEEIENRVVNLAVSTTKLSGRLIMGAGLKALAVIQSRKQSKGEVRITGKQKISDLVGQNQGVTNIDVAKTDLKGFEKYARKYGVDYAVTKDKSVMPSKYLVFFKARDADAMTAAFQAYSTEILKRKQRPSVRKTLQQLIEKVKVVPMKGRTHDKERGKER